MIQIEKNVPIPEPQKTSKSGGISAAVRMLDVGDSFHVSCADSKALTRVRVNAANASRRAGIKVTSRKIGDGVRIWRTA